MRFIERISSRFSTGCAMLAEVVYYATLFVTSSVVARKFGPTIFGQFSLNFFLAALLLSVGNGGFTSILRRNLAKREFHTVSSELLHFLLIRLFVGGVVAIVGCSYLVFTQTQANSMIFMFIPVLAARFFDGLSEIPYSYFLVNSDFWQLLKLRLLFCASYFLLFVLEWFERFRIIPFCWLLALASFLSFMWFSFKLSKSLILKFTKLDINVIAKAYKESWPLILNAGVFAIYSRYWIFYADKIFPKEQMAPIIAAMTVLNALLLFPNSLGSVFFPKMCVLAVKGKTEFVGFIVKLSIFLFVMGLIVSLLTNIFSSIVLLPFGNIGELAQRYLKMLSISVIAAFLLPVIGYVTTVVGRQKVGLFIAICMMLISFPIYPFMVSSFGINGIVCAYTVLQYCMLLGNLIFFVIYFALT